MRLSHSCRLLSPFRKRSIRSSSGKVRNRVLEFIYQGDEEIEAITVDADEAHIAIIDECYR